MPEAVEERRALARKALPKVGALIGGDWRYDLDGGRLTHIEPGNGEATGSFPIAGPADVEDAVAAAAAGLEIWRTWSAPQRSEALRSLGAAISEHAQELALLTTLETGTPIAMTTARMATVPQSWFDYYAGWCDKLAGDTIPQVHGDHLQYTVYEPVGVVAKLVTWNSPIGGVQMAVPAALAAGCSVVIKPPELAPFTITRFGQLCQEVGLPPGVIGILPAGPTGSEALVRHPSVAKVSFTGGPDVAKALQRSAADAVTPLVLELGGKSANIVFPDADLSRAIGHASMICALSGQGCALPSRLLVHEDVHDEVVDGVVAALSTLTLGDPFDSRTSMGPLISGAAMERVLGMVDRAIDDGASVALGGKRRSTGPSTGFFVEPTVLVDVDHASEIAQKEVFGPVLSVLRFRSEDQAVAMANDTSYGLVAYVHTSDLSRAMRMVKRLSAGSVSINGGPAPSGAHAPFGGMKESGYGREGGREGMLEFTALKTVTITT